MGIIMGALGGMGGQMVNIAQQNQKLWDEQDLMKQREEAEINKVKALDQYRRETNAAAGASITAGSDQLRLGRIAGIINQANGSDLKPEDVKDIAANPEALKAYGIVDRTRAAEYDDKASIAESQGLMDHARGFRDQQNLELNRTREDNREARDDKRSEEANRRMDIQQKFNEDRAKYQDKLAAIAEARANRMEGRQGSQMEKAELQSTRQALSSVLKDIGTQEDKLQTRLADPMLDPAQKAVLAKQMATLDADRISTRNHLLELAGVETPKAATAQEPAVKYDAQGRAYVKGPDGKPMLKSDAEAKTASAAPSQPAAPVRQGFNEAGYADVQSTIDGARRGDTKALGMLQTLISRGVTTPKQRQQITEITGGR